MDKDLKEAKRVARQAQRAAAELEGQRAVSQMVHKAQGGPLPQGAGDLRVEQTSHLLATLQMTLRELDEEVKAEEQGAEELRRHMQRLRNEHAELKKIRDRAALVVEGFEAKGATFDKEYQRLMDNADTTYKFVRGKHKDAIKILSADDTFAYHPAYKRHTDQFEAAYFAPVPLKKAEEKKSPAQIKLEKFRKQGSLAQAGSMSASSS